MLKKGLLTSVLLTVLLVFTGCNNDTAQVKISNISVNTDNELMVTDLSSYMLPLAETQKDRDMLSSIKAEVADNPIDFSSVMYSEDMVCVGDVVYVEGVIPEKDYPPDRVYIYSDPEDSVSFENANLTNKDGDTILTFDVVGEKVGTATVYVGIYDSDYSHSFDLDIVEVSSRTTPEYSGYTVYCTPTGGKYHAYGCSYLRGNGIAIGLEEALSRGLGPCSRCNP